MTLDDLLKKAIDDDVDNSGMRRTFNTQDDVARWREEEKVRREAFWQDFNSSLQAEMPGISAKAMEEIRAYCWQEGHAGGYYEVVLTLANILSMLKAMLPGAAG